MTNTTRTMRRRFRTAPVYPAAVALLAATAIALAGCASAPTNGPTAPQATVSAEASTVVTVSDAWVKAVDEGMSGGFGVLTNTGTSDVTVVSAASAAAHMIELHETTESDTGEMAMREVEGGFTIPAGGSLLLEPGAKHLMFMGLTAPLHAGEQLDVTLTFADGSTLTFSAPVKDYSGANENYESGH